MMVWIFLVMWWSAWLVVPLLYKKRMHYIGVIVLLGPMILYSGYQVFMAYYAVWYQKDIVCQRVIVRVGPGDGHGSCGVLDPGAVVLITQNTGEWICIRTSAICGWIPRASCAGEAGKRSEVM